MGLETDFHTMLTVQPAKLDRYCSPIFRTKAAGACVVLIGRKNVPVGLKSSFRICSLNNVNNASEKVTFDGPFVYKPPSQTRYAD